MADVRTLPVGEDDEARVTLDDLAREGARRMIAAALEAEVDDYVSSFVDEVGEDGKRLVVRNGRARERRVTVGSGTVPIKAPRVNDRRVDEETGERKRFSSRILPAYARRSPKVNRGAADPVPAWALDRRLRARAAGSARRGRLGAVVQLDPATDRAVAGRARGVPHAGAAGFIATATCSWTGSTSACASARTRNCACWS
jgi:hypothetical protein